MPWQEPGNVVVSPDGTTVYASDNSVAVALSVDPSTGALSLIDTYDSPGRVAEMAPDGRHVYFAGGFTNYRLASFARDAQGRLTPVPSPELQEIVFDLTASPDGRQIYAADSRAGAVVIFDRDPATGVLARRTSVELPITGEPRWNKLKTLELSPDGKFLYAQVYEDHSKLVTLRRADDGGLEVVGDLTCNICGLDLAVSPDGRYLFDDFFPTTLDRDPATGVLSNPRDNPGAPRTGGKPEVRDGRMSLSPDGKTLYMLDTYADHLLAANVNDGSVTALATYREAVDGVQGLRDAQSVTVSPDGTKVFVASGEANYGKLGRIASFRRDPATGLLTFADLEDGPDPSTVPPGGGTPAITINDGALYTRTPQVQVKLTGVDASRVPFVELSNDGGFAKSEKRWGNSSGLHEWTLASSGPERLPKTVYFRLGGPGSGNILSDDIILDERDPILQYVEAPKAAKRPGKKVKLKVRAKDTVSGVASIQVATNKHKPGKWAKFTSRPVIRTSRKATWVRVKDRAGNASRWQKAKVKR